MMIKRYFPRNYIVQLLVILIMYGYIGFIAVVELEQYYVLGVLACLAVLLLNNRINLYEDRLTYYRAFTKTQIYFRDIERFSINDYRPWFARFSLPAMFVISKNEKRNVIYYKNFSQAEMSEIISEAIKKNKDIRICPLCNLLLAGKKSNYDIKKEKQANQIAIIILVAIVIGIFLGVR